MSGKTHVVVVDDDKDVRETLDEYLSLHGYRISAFEDGAGLRAFVATEEPFDLALLDVTMPGEDGLSLARFLRERTEAAVIMVTASGATIDRVVGLEMGADDYLPKPVDLRELQARIKAVLRRTAVRQESGKTTVVNGDLIPVGKCQLDIDAHRLYDGNGEEVDLTAMEFDLLRVFTERPNRILTRDQLLEFAHNRGWEPFDRSIDIRIARIRKKIEADPGKPQVIKTIRGAGYLFSPSPA